MFEPIATTIVLAVAVFFALDALRLTRRKSSVIHFDTPTPEAALVFDGELLGFAEGSLEPLAQRGRQACLEALEARFPRLSEELDALGASGQCRLIGLIQHEELHLTLRGTALRIELILNDTLTPSEHREIDALREALSESPLPIWRSSAQNETIWANRAYLDALPPQTSQWPLPALFDDPAHPVLHDRHFHIRNVPSENGETLHFATDITVQTALETQHRSLLDKFTHLYATLPFGMALLDQNSTLVQFNPTFLTLLGLPSTSLLAGPSLRFLLSQMPLETPLPPDWLTRLTLQQPIALALSNGQSLTLTSAPSTEDHLLLFLQDTTAEVQLLHSLNANNALLLRALNALEEAIAIFDQDGKRLYTSESYQQLLPTTTSPYLFADLQHWQNQFGPLSLAEGWQEVRTGRICLTPIEGGQMLLRLDTIEARTSLLPASLPNSIRA